MEACISNGMCANCNPHKRHLARPSLKWVIAAHCTDIMGTPLPPSSCSATWCAHTHCHAKHTCLLLLRIEAHALADVLAAFVTPNVEWHLKPAGVHVHGSRGGNGGWVGGLKWQDGRQGGCVAAKYAPPHTHVSRALVAAC